MKISCNNDDHKCKNTNTKLLYKNDGLEASPDDVGTCLSTGRSTKWWSQKLHKKEYGHMVICMEIVQDMYFQHITDWGSGCWDYRVCLFKPIIFTDQRHISEVFAVSKPLQRKRRVNFNSPKVEAGQWVTGHYWMKDKPHHIVNCSLLTGAKITLWPSISSSSSQVRVTSENSLASLSSPKEELTCRGGKVISDPKKFP